MTETGNTFQTISVLGAGTMGAGIAQVAAQSGFNVLLYDLSDDFLDTGMQRIQGFLQKGLAKGKISQDTIQQVEENLTTTTDLKTASQVDLVIEAVPESMALKKKIFQQIDQEAFRHTVIASNTSSLSITEMASATKRAEKVAGLHFFNPVPLMQLVEIIQGAQTSDETVQQLFAFTKTLGKTPVLAKDTPGFIVNRVARPFYGEALRMLGENIAGDHITTIKTIDTVMRDVGGFKMGPFELMDLIGIDVNFSVTQSVYNGFSQEPRFKPHTIQQRMVEAGTLGRKTGQGFYTYD